MHMQSTIYKGRRCSTAEAFLRPNSHRENLHIATEAHVTKVSVYQVELSLCSQQGQTRKTHSNFDTDSV